MKNMKLFAMVFASLSSLLLFSGQASAQAYCNSGYSSGYHGGYGRYPQDNNVSVGVHIGGGSGSIGIRIESGPRYRHPGHYPHPGQRFPGAGCHQPSFQGVVIEYVQVRVPVTCVDRCGRVVHTGQYRYVTQQVQRRVHVYWDNRMGCYVYRDGHGRTVIYRGPRY